MFQFKNKIIAIVSIIVLFIVLLSWFNFSNPLFLSSLGKKSLVMVKETNSLFSAFQRKLQDIFNIKKADSSKEEPEFGHLFKDEPGEFCAIVSVDSEDNFAESEEDLSKDSDWFGKLDEESLDDEEMSKLANQEGFYARNLPDGKIGENYYVYLNPLWSIPPYRWQFSGGRVPAGIQLDGINGILHGVPEKGGVWDFVIKITDAKEDFILIQYHLIVVEFDYEEASDALQITTENVPDPFVGVDYFVQIGARGGSLPYSWSISSGLPPGLSFERTAGIIYSVPQDSGSYNFRVTVIDSDFKQVSKNYNIEVNTSPLYITTTSLAAGIVGKNYYQSIEAQGGKPPYTWQIISGILPDGIVFETETATLSGMPQRAQSETIRVKVTDSKNNQDTAELRIDISSGPLSISTTDLHVGTIGEDYYEHLYAQGGVPPYTWEAVDGNLPAGIVFQGIGILIGTPLAAIESNLTFKVIDQINNRVQTTLNLTILGGPLTIQTFSLQEGSVGIEFYQQLEATGGILPYVWNVQSGELPNGISLNPNGVLSGAPTEPAMKDVEIKVTGSNQDIDVRNYVFVINDESLMIITDFLDVGVSEQEYSFQLQATGGVLPYHWIITSGALPQNLELNNNGLILGLPQEIGIFPFEVKVFDNHQHSGTKDFHLDVIEEEIEITTGILPGATVGTPYEVALEVNGGVAPYLWSIFSGGLPGGLQLNENTGIISGMSSESGDFPVAFKAIDTIGNWTIKEFNLVVEGTALSIVTETLPNGLLGTYYEAMLEAEGGTPLYEWSIISGSLPEGFILNGETGVISDVPIQSEHSYFIVRVTDQNENQDSKAFSILIEIQPLVILTENLPDGKVGAEYFCTLEASGGMLPYTWNFILGQLPENLVLNNETGDISGIPSEQVENLLLTFQVIDDNQQTDQKTLDLTIDSPDLNPVTGFIARGSHKKIGLAWVNPEDPNFDYVKVVRNELNFSQDPNDGIEVYSGAANNIVDNNVFNETTYYYTAFAFDNEGDYFVAEDGSQASATPHEVTLFGPYGPYADAVISFEPLDLDYYLTEECPDMETLLQVVSGLVLGWPMGGGEWSGSLDVVSLHARVNDDGEQTPPYGGNIILQFTDNIIVNGPGPDFTVFENAFRIQGTDSYWMEPAVVDVSQDGIHYYRFPFDFVPHYDGDELDLQNPYCYAMGFAGVWPVYSYDGNPNPTDPSVSGGDQFDLSSITAVNLAWIQYIKITSIGDNWLVDINGDFVRHTHEWPTWGCSGTGNSGFDLDAAAAINY